MDDTLVERLAEQAGTLGQLTEVDIPDLIDTTTLTAEDLAALSQFASRVLVPATRAVSLLVSAGYGRLALLEVAR